MDFKEDWVEDCTCRLSQYLKDINKIWTEIGYSDRHRTENQNSLIDELSLTLQNALSSAEKGKAEIELKIHEMKVQIEQIENELGLRHRLFPNSKRLLSVLEDLTAYRGELDKKIVELTAEFRKLKSYEEDLCQMLAVPALEGFSLIPTSDDKLRVQTHIDELRELKSQRQSNLYSMKRRILSCIDYLKSDCTLSPPESVREIIESNSEPKNLSAEFMSEVGHSLDQHLYLFEKFKSEEEEIFTEIGSLLRRLDLPPFDLPEKTSKCPSERIKKGSDELFRLRELRLANLSRLMDTCVLELESLWTDCSVNVTYRQTFRNETSMEPTESNLTRLENEVSKWKRFKLAHQDFYSAFIVWADTLQQIKAIELKRQDPIVLKNRGGILLKLDKEDRKLRNRDLPSHTAHLKSILALESQGVDAELFSLVCYDGHSLTGGEKENCLASIIGKSLDSSGTTSAGSSNPQVKGGYVYAASKRPQIDIKPALTGGITRFSIGYQLELGPSVIIRHESNSYIPQHDTQILVLEPGGWLPAVGPIDITHRIPLENTGNLTKMNYSCLILNGGIGEVDHLTPITQEGLYRNSSEHDFVDYFVHQAYKF
ncbi:hypothetical protein Aperf_G00000078594 [Anoplocephala perfoliata]